MLPSELTNTITYIQLPATASNECTTDARLGGVGRVPPPPILAVVPPTAALQHRNETWRLQQLVEMNPDDTDDRLIDRVLLSCKYLRVLTIRALLCAYFIVCSVVAVVVEDSIQINSVPT